MARKLRTLLLLAAFASVVSCNNNTTSDKAQLEDSITKPSTSQVTTDSVAFFKMLTFGDVSFDITSIGEGSLQQVTIQSFGPSIEKKVMMMKLDPITSAEVADLNSDGHAELLVYTQSAGSGSYGKVVAFSVNNGKSISQVTFPETSNNSKINKGYRGHDKFAIVNNQLTQEFPIYNSSDTNAEPTGKKRVVTYKLVDGEASRVFVVNKVKEVPR